MSATLPSQAERFLLALATAETRAWVQSTRAYTRARRALPLVKARLELGRIARHAANEPGAAAALAEITRRIDETTCALRLAIGRRDMLAAMRRSALVAAHALALRDRLGWDAVALLTAPYRDILERRAVAGG